jgi:hypothetical protein
MTMEMLGERERARIEAAQRREAERLRVLELALRLRTAAGG